MPIEPDRLYHELGYLIAEMPDLAVTQWQTAEAQRWLGRASAWIEQSDNMIDVAAFNAAVNSLSPNPRFPNHIAAVPRITTILYRALGRAELQASPASRGAFIP